MTQIFNICSISNQENFSLTFVYLSWFPPKSYCNILEPVSSALLSVNEFYFRRYFLSTTNNSHSVQYALTVGDYSEFQLVSVKHIVCLKISCVRNVPSKLEQCLQSRMQVRLEKSSRFSCSGSILQSYS